MQRQVEGYDNLVRDEYSNAVINNDITAFEQFKAKRLKEKQDQQRIDDLEKRVQKLESALSILLNQTTEE